METRRTLFVGGRWVPPGGSDGVLSVIDPATEEVFGTVPNGTAGDVDDAVHAARGAFADWAGAAPEERARVLGKVADALVARTDELGALITHEMGMPLSLSALIQVGLPTLTFADAAQRASQIVWEQEAGNSLIVKEPVGVVGAITPWNFPLHQVANKVAAALAVGCTVVLKPSEVAPLSAFVLAELLEEAGLPPGAFNLVSGVGPVVGEAIAAHPGVDMVSFTGSLRAGTRVMQLAAKHITKVTLELGGKSANIILEDADLPLAVRRGVDACYLNGGQTCSALTRMLVPHSRLDEAGAIAADAAEAYVVGDPFDPATTMGPLASAAQRERVLDYIRQGVDAGYPLVAGGLGSPAATSRGYFVRPTVFCGVENTSVIAQQEIFGPVLCIIPYEDEEHAVAMANDSPYGLAGGVWSGDLAHAESVARRLRTGQVELNGGAFNPIAPFGGYKRSGIGRELGAYGLEEYLEVKALQR
jgi:aldehyde dehydrogenase (NAD+)